MIVEPERAVAYVEDKETRQRLRAAGRRRPRCTSAACTGCPAWARGFLVLAPQDAGPHAARGDFDNQPGFPNASLHGPPPEGGRLNAMARTTNHWPRLLAACLSGVALHPAPAADKGWPSRCGLHGRGSADTVAVAPGITDLLSGPERDDPALHGARHRNGGGAANCWRSSSAARVMPDRSSFAVPGRPRSPTCSSTAR